MAIRVLFVPFQLPGNIPYRTLPGQSYIRSNNNWINHCKKKAIDDDGTPHDIFQLFYHGVRSPMIAGLGSDDQIYIRGHSQPGVECIYDQTKYNESGRPIGADDMDADLYFTLNPKQKAQPNLKFSLGAAEVVDRLIASGLQQSYRGKVKCYNCHSAEGERNFSKAVVRELRAKGYKKCPVYGYTGSIQTEYQGQDHRMVAGGDGEAGRVSRHRERVRS